MKRVIKINRYSFVIFLLTSLLSTSTTKAQNFWFESQNTYSYRNSDFFVKNLKNYHLMIMEPRIGFRFHWRKIDAYMEPYIMISLVDDVGNNNWNRVDWHNNIVYGLGGRLRFYPTIWNLQEFNFDFFLEHLWISYFKNQLFFTGHRPSTDLKVGAKYWLASDIWNGTSGSPFYLWFENAGSLFYAKSSFFNQSQMNYYLMNFHGKIGPGFHISEQIEAHSFFVLEAVRDLGTELWNKLDWYNRLYFGFGMRLKHSRFPNYKPGKMNFIVMPFIEFLWVKYTNRTIYLPSYRPETDKRAGLHVWISYDNEEE